VAGAPIPTTRVTLLGRLRQDPTDQAAWDVFVERYGRHIYRWCRQWRLQDADAEDVTQDILLSLAQKLRHFAYDPSRTFAFSPDGRRALSGSGHAEKDNSVRLCQPPE
jgi:RNA polymerase sigma-70 factor (ECF subfamily)